MSAPIILPGSGDIAVILGPDGLAPNGIVVDVATAPSGDLGLVTDMARLQQDVILRLNIPRGTSPFFPNLGNDIFRQIGRPFSDPAELTDAIADIESQLLAEHASDASNGQRPSSAALKSLKAEPPQVAGTLANLQVTATAEDDAVSLLTAGG